MMMTSPSASALSAPGGAALAKTAWSAYKASLLTNPLPTKATTSMIISGISDTIVQRSTNPKEKTPVKNDDMEMTMEDPSVQVTYKHDWKRTYHVLLTGFMYSAPIAHYWYNLLEILVSKIPAIQGDPLIGVVVARIGLDMVLFSPVTIAGYFSVRTLLETKSLQACRAKLHTTSLVANLEGSVEVLARRQSVQLLESPRRVSSVVCQCHEFVMDRILDLCQFSKRKSLEKFK